MWDRRVKSQKRDGKRERDINTVLISIHLLKNMVGIISNMRLLQAT